MTMSGTECPFHDLPPGEVIWIKFGEDGPCLPYSAQRACDDWHTDKMIEDSGIRENVVEAFDRMIIKEGYNDI